jgi:hypothetical protein
MTIFISPGARIRVLDLQPSHSAARPVASVPPLRDYALKPQSAGVAKDGLTIALQVLAEAHPLYALDLGVVRPPNSQA